MLYSIYIILWFTVAVPSLLGALYYRNLSKPMRLFVFVMWMGFLTEAGLRITANSNNIYLANIYTCIETALLTLFFAEIMSNKRAKQIIKIAGSLIFIIIICEMSIEGVSEWVSLSSTLECIFIIVAGLYYFYEVAMAISPEYPLQSPSFWFTIIITFYFMSSLEYFLLNRYLENVSKRDLMMLGDIHTFVNAFCNLAYGLIIWKFTRLHSLAQL